MLCKLATIDARTLGILRIVLGILIALDLALKLPSATLFYSSAGIVSNNYLNASPYSILNWSILRWFTSPLEVHLFLCAGILIAVLFAAGYFTKLCHIALFLILLWLEQRNDVITYGGELVLRIIILWTLLLPLGARLSFDARAGRCSAPEQVCSLAVLGLYLQIAAIYFVTALNKDGSTWQEGSALYYFLYLDPVITPLGAWVREYSSVSTLKLLSWSTLIVEYLIGVLILSPIATRKSRQIAGLLSVALQVGIMACTQILLFQAVMIAITLTLFTPTWLERLGARFPSLLPANVPPRREAGRNCGQMLNTICAVILLITTTFQLVFESHVLRAAIALPRPAWVVVFNETLRIREVWDMFAPEAPKALSWIVIAATLDDGSVLDPQTGAAPNFEFRKRPAISNDVHWFYYSLALALETVPGLRADFDRWLRTPQSRLTLAPEKRVAAYTVWKVSSASPPFGIALTGQPDDNLSKRETSRTVLFSSP